MALWSTMNGPYSQASSPPLLWVISKEMTHETPLLLLCRQLWPCFTEQLTVNWRFSSPNHLIVSVALRISPRFSLQCCVQRCCFFKQTLYHRPPVTVLHSGSSSLCVFTCVFRKGQNGPLLSKGLMMKQWRAAVQRPQALWRHAAWRSCRPAVWSGSGRGRCSGRAAGAPSSAPAQAAR